MNCYFCHEQKWIFNFFTFEDARLAAPLSLTLCSDCDCSFTDAQLRKYVTMRQFSNHKLGSLTLSGFLASLPKGSK